MNKISPLKIINYIYKLRNQVKLRLLNAKTGKNITIHGNIKIRVFKNYEFRIGDNFYLSSGNHINPLSRNEQASIRINENGKLFIGNNVGMSSPIIWVHKKIEIGNNVLIGASTIILDSDCHSLNHLDRRFTKKDLENKKDLPITIKDDVLIGTRCIILKGVTIGERCIIGAGSVVTQNIPNDCIACGNPARIIKKNSIEAIQIKRSLSV